MNKFNVGDEVVCNSKLLLVDLGKVGIVKSKIPAAKVEIHETTVGKSMDGWYEVLVGGDKSPTAYHESELLSVK